MSISSQIPRTENPTMDSSSGTLREIDYRKLMADVERVVDEMEVGDEDAPTVQRLANALTRSFGAEMGLTGGRLYVQQGDEYRLWATFGDAKDVEPGTRVSKDYPPVQMSIAAGTLYMNEQDPRLDRVFEDRIGSESFAVAVAGGSEYLLAFDVRADHRADQVLFALGLLRHAINQKIQQQQVRDVLREARRIQQAILPREKPHFHSFDIAGRSEPLESVGGDFFDYIPITDKILGLVLADVSGHGLPAALQVRDIYMGLRMGMSRDFKIVRTVERLNQIIHQSRSTSRFVSMFYGELESDGTLIYVNAGHPPPVLLGADGRRQHLVEGGVVLGPIPNATYHRGFLRLERGDLLVACTDGVLETRAGGSERAGEEYGLDRLLAVCESHRDRESDEIVDAVFADLAEFSSHRPAADDRTLAVLKLQF